MPHLWADVDTPAARGHSGHVKTLVHMQPRGAFMPHLWADVDTPAAREHTGQAKILGRMQPRGTFMPHLATLVAPRRPER